MRVGRGSDEIDQLDSLAGAVTPKPPINAEKSKVLRTDRPTDRQTDRVGHRVACTRLKRPTAKSVRAEAAMAKAFKASKVNARASKAEAEF